MTRFILLSALILSLIACGGGSNSTSDDTTVTDSVSDSSNSGSGSDSNSSESDTGTGGDTNSNESNTVGIIGEDLSTTQAALEAIDNLPGMSKSNLPLLVGEWNTFEYSSATSTSYHLWDKKIAFNLDGTYSSSSFRIGTEPQTTVSSGTWTVYTQSDSNQNLLIMVSEDGQISDFPLEFEGENGFRLIYHGATPVAGSAMFTRVDSNIPTIYPGMFLLGTFEHYNYSGEPDQYRFVYRFSEDGKVIRQIYGDYTYDRELQSETTGSWLIDTNSYQLIVNLPTETIVYDIDYVEYNRIDLVPIGEDPQLWNKIEFINFADDGVERLSGEYRDRNSASYISISRNGNDYFVDLVEQYDQTDIYYQIPATLSGPHELSFTIPESATYNYNAGKPVVMHATFNQLIFSEKPSTLLTGSRHMEKVSNIPLEDSANLPGGWTNSLFSSLGYMKSLKFLSDGMFLDTGIQGRLEYGEYSFDGTYITFDKVCEAPETTEVIFDGHLIDIDGIRYNQVPRTHTFGDESSALTRVLFQHSLDKYQSENGPLLVPHPEITNVYLFENETHYDGIFASFTLRPDGTGQFFSGSIEYYEDVYTGEWLGSQTTGGAFNLKYFVIIEDGKEYLAYYYDGLFLGDYGNLHTVGAAEGNIDDVKFAEIYHGRTAICYEYSGIENTQGIIMPLSEE